MQHLRLGTVFTSVPHEAVVGHAQVQLHHLTGEFAVTGPSCQCQVLMVMQALLQFGGGVEVGLRALGESARGIAVVTPDVGTDDLETLAAHGVVGTRFNLVQWGVMHESMVAAVAASALRLGWHLQFHLLPGDLLRLADELIELPVTVVLDHYGRAMTDPSLALAVQSRLEQLLATGKVWLKLSAPYLASTDPDDFGSLQEFVERLARRHADRLVWGTDWPHVTEAKKPDDVHLLNEMRRWVADTELETRVIVENASDLYGF